MDGRHIALLRGINVGHAKRVAMADLRALFDELGYQDVGTLLNSGNVVFTAPRSVRGNHAARIEKAIAARLAVSTRVTLLTVAELATIVRQYPLWKFADNPSRLLVTVLTDPADRARLQPLTREKWAPEALAIGARVTYIWCPKGIIDSRVAASVNKVLGDGATTRNWATMTKLHALAGDAD